MAELVDAHGSGPCGGNTVEVRVLFWAPSKQTKAASLLDSELMRFFVARSLPVKVSDRWCGLTIASHFTSLCAYAFFVRTCTGVVKGQVLRIMARLL